MDLVPDTFPNLFIGYSVIWLLLAVLVWGSFRRVRRLEVELQRLKEQSSCQQQSS